MSGSDHGRVGAVAGAVVAQHAALLELADVAWGVIIDGELVAGDDVDSVYRIASMTKSFTCAAILSLRDDGVLRLDDPVAELAPEFAHIVGPTADSPPITIRHLMTMGAGFATDDAWADRHLDVSDGDLDAWLVDGISFAHAPNTAWEYSNLGFALLGRVVRRVSGQRVQDVVTQRLLEPLGMTNSTWTAPAGAKPGHRERADEGDEPFLGDGAIAPMGGLFTTVNDLVRWTSFLLDAWPARDDPDDAPLRRASRREMQQIQRGFAPRVVTARDGRQRTLSGGYGFGLNVMHHETLGSVVNHSGGLPGFGSNMRWAPRAGVAVVGLANSTYAWMAAVTAAVLDALVTNGLVEARTPTASKAVRDAAEILVALHNDWDDSLARACFADNVTLDDTFARRAQRAQAAAGGPWQLARVVTDSMTEATVIAHGPESELRIEFQLHPLVPPLVQWYEATVVDN